MAQPEPVLAAHQGSETPGRSAPTRRGTELAMLGFAAGLVTGALMLVEANQEQTLQCSTGSG